MKAHPLLQRRGAPDDPDGILRYGAVILRVAHPQLVLLRYENPFGLPEGSVEEAVKLGSEDLELIEITSENIRPLDWLVEKAVDGTKYFPESMDLREIFGKKFPIADGE